MTLEFVPIESFQLRWRFTDPNFNVLPDEVIARIQPLSLKSAHKMWDGVRPKFEGSSISKRAFPYQINRPTTGDRNTVRQWLEQNLTNLEQVVTVLWNSETSVQAKLSDFCAYWDDFYYPGSDDVVVLSVGLEWILYFFHEEVVTLGKAV